MAKVDVIFVFQSQPPADVDVKLITRHRPKPKTMEVPPTPHATVAMTKVDGTTGAYIAKGVTLPAVDLTKHKVLFRIEATGTIGGVKEKFAVIDSPAANHLKL